VGALERIGFYGVQGNLIMYLTGPLGMSTAAAASGVNTWPGTVQVLPLVGALAADSRIGRYRAVMAGRLLYLLVSATGSVFAGRFVSMFSDIIGSWMTRVLSLNFLPGVDYFTVNVRLIC
jgi:dipeptide/tripeptide permease